MYIISWLPHIYYYEYVSAPYEDFGHRRDNIIIIIIIFRVCGVIFNLDTQYGIFNLDIIPYRVATVP